VRRAQLAAVAQVALEGVPLPAPKRELVEYALRQRASYEVVEALDGLPDGTYARLDAVGEALAPTQPAPVRPVRVPEPESGAVPGGDSYLDPRPTPGEIREQPEVLEYEQSLVREPAAPGEGIPQKGSRDRKPSATD
jgi:hypothetical protein